MIRLKNVLVATDFSETSEVALAYGRAQVAPPNTMRVSEPAPLPLPDSLTLFATVAVTPLSNEHPVRTLTIRRPPFGMIARRNGELVCRPTISS